MPVLLGFARRPDPGDRACRDRDFTLAETPPSAGWRTQLLWRRVLRAAPYGGQVVGACGAAILNRIPSQRRNDKVYLGVVVIVLVVLSAVLLEDSYVRRLLKEAMADSSGVANGVPTVAWWCLAAWLAATLLSRASHRYLFPRDDQPKRRKILSDMACGLIYLGAGFGILQFAFHQPMTGLLATSGIVALVIGLAMQSRLARSILRNCAQHRSAISCRRLDQRGRRQ
jgi:hypothetical protein